MVGRLFYIVSVIILVVTLVSPSVNALEAIPPSDTVDIVPQSTHSSPSAPVNEGLLSMELAADQDAESPTPPLHPPVESLPIVETKILDNPIAEPETTPPVIVTSFRVSQGLDDIELYNQTDTFIAASSIRFVVSHGGTVCETHFAADGWIHARSFLSGGMTNDCEHDGYVSRVEVYVADIRVQLIEGIPMDGNWWRHKSTVVTTTNAGLVNCSDKSIPSNMKQSGVIADYVSCPRPSNACNDGCLRTSELYALPANAQNLRIVEIMTDSRSCAPADQSLDCFDFIKVKNVGDAAVNLAEYRLRTGASTSSSTATNTYYWQQPTLHPQRDEFLLDSNMTLTVTKRDNGDWLSLTNGSGNVWIEDYYGVQSYDSVSYDGMGLAAARSKSWAFHESINGWAYGVPSPFTENRLFVASAPGIGATDDVTMQADCGEGRERNPATNRCRNIPTASTLAPCKEGQYRSEETNRCRSIASAAAAELKPCADDQFRNPLTNRCRKIASADELADCGEGRERNPDTNRCRNIATSQVPGAAFAVQPIKDSTVAFAGWWALGGVGLLALGYAAWEWRREMQARIRRIISYFSANR